MIAALAAAAAEPEGPSKMLAVAGWVVGVLGLSAALGAAFVLFKSNVNKATTELWKGEAEAQKARGDRLESALADLTVRVERVEQENKTLREMASASREIAALTKIVESVADDMADIKEALR